MRLAYFDAFSGASGDMILGALIDAGLDAELLKAELAKLNLPGYRIDVRREKRGALMGTRFDVIMEHAEHHHRNLADITQIINESEIDGAAKEKAVAIFRRLAEAEATVHGTAPEEVHFHEVGAVDSIVDITGAAIGITALGIERIECSPIAVGHGMISIAHGTLPVPAPAVAELLKGAPIRETDEEGELTTPTGAAVLVTLCSKFGSPPAMVIEEVGYGAGARQGKHAPNL
ncbi:MAG: LarC family nickel insertion protein, partial [Phycisphaerae bacterium]|nr:LarC family nickel insertion protein [Phycisphaerae bacterium]